MSPGDSRAVSGEELLQAALRLAPEDDLARRLITALESELRLFAGKPNERDTWQGVMRTVDIVLHRELQDVDPDLVPTIEVHLVEGQPGQVSVIVGGPPENRMTPVTLFLHETEPSTPYSPQETSNE